MLSHHSGGTLLYTVVPSESVRLSLFSEERWTEDGEQLLQSSDLQKHPDLVAPRGFGHSRDPAAAASCQRRCPHTEEVPRQVKTRIIPQSFMFSILEPEHGARTTRNDCSCRFHEHQKTRNLFNYSCSKRDERVLIILNDCSIKMKNYVIIIHN